MVDQNSNDNDAANDGRLRASDPHGQAALSLIESLLHALIARSVVSVAEAAEIVEVATDATEAAAIDLGDPRLALDRAVTILRSLRASLVIDLPS